MSLNIDESVLSFAKALVIGIAGADVTRIQLSNGIRNVCDYIKLSQGPTRQKLVKAYSRYRNLCPMPSDVDALKLISRLFPGVNSITPEVLENIQISLSDAYKIRIIEFKEKGTMTYNIIWSSPYPTGIPINIISCSEHNVYTFSKRFFPCFKCYYVTDPCDACGKGVDFEQFPKRLTLPISLTKSQKLKGAPSDHDV